jgi:hypothetical protein
MDTTGNGSLYPDTTTRAIPRPGRVHSGAMGTVAGLLPVDPRLVTEVLDLIRGRGTLDELIARARARSRPGSKPPDRRVDAHRLWFDRARASWKELDGLVDPSAANPSASILATGRRDALSKELAGIVGATVELASRIEPSWSDTWLEWPSTVFARTKSPPTVFERPRVLLAPLLEAFPGARIDPELVGMFVRPDRVKELRTILDEERDEFLEALGVDTDNEDCEALELIEAALSHAEERRLGILEVADL